MIVGVSSDVPWFVHMVLGIGIAFFYVYQIIDAVRTAKAVQLGEPAPDPSVWLRCSAAAAGVEQLPRGEITTKVPVAAAVLIGLGLLFLFNTAFDFSLHRYWPLILIVLGVYLFAKQWGLLGGYRPACVCERCRMHRLMGPAILVTLGVLFLLDNVSNVDFGKTWPAILLVIGVVKLCAEQCFLRWSRRTAAAGSAGLPAQRSATSGNAGNVLWSDRGNDCGTGHRNHLFWGGEKCLTP